MIIINKISKFVKITTVLLIGGNLFSFNNLKFCKDCNSKPILKTKKIITYAIDETSQEELKKLIKEQKCFLLNYDQNLISKIKENFNKIENIISGSDTISLENKEKLQTIYQEIDNLLSSYEEKIENILEQLQSKLIEIEEIILEQKIKILKDMVSTKNKNGDYQEFDEEQKQKFSDFIEICNNFNFISEKKLKEIFLGHNEDFPIVFKNNKVINPENKKIVSRYGNLYFYREAVSRLTSVAAYIFNEYSPIYKDDKNDFKVQSFLSNFNRYIGELRKIIAKVTNTVNSDIFGDLCGNQPLYDPFNIDNSKLEYIEKRVKKGYYSDCNWNIRFGSDDRFILGGYAVFENGEFSSITFNEENKKFLVKSLHLKKILEFDSIKNFGIVTSHVGTDSAIYASEEFSNVFNSALELKNNKNCPKLIEEFKKNILEYTWKANKSSTFKRGQATLFL